MNTLFNIANVYLHYRGGKHVGLAGLIGVLIAIITILIWPDMIQPVVNFIGLNDIGKEMGITGEGVGAAAITTYNVIVLYLFACLAFSLIIGIGLAAYIFGNVALGSNVGGTIIGIVIFVLLSPVLIWYVIYQTIILNKKNVSTITIGPDEKQRIKKNKDLINYLTEESLNNSLEELTKEEAINYLNKVPVTTDEDFLLGITYNRDIILLLPRPFGENVYGTTDLLIGVPLEFEKFIPLKHDPYGVNGARNPKRYYMRYEERIKQWASKDIEIYLKPTHIYDVYRVAVKFFKTRFYEDYVRMVYKHINFKTNVENDNYKREAIID